MKYVVFLKQLFNSLSILFIAISLLTSCASSNLESEEKRGSAPAHPAAYSQEHFTFNKPHKQREYNNFDFYYKHCNVDERKPFPTGAIWECTEP